MSSRLFTEGKANTKLAKSGASGEYMTLGLFMAPHTLNGQGINLCPFATAECAAACLNTAGRAGMFKSIGIARKRKANEFLADRAGFIERLKREIALGVKRADKAGKQLVVRLNGTTDIDFPSHVFESFPSVQFYDYTKSPYRMAHYIAGELPANYHVTFSFSGTNLEQSLAVLSQGANVSVVFSSANFPETWHGYKVYNGDKTDLRFTDPSGVVVGLKAKGKARKVTVGGFIQIGRN